MRRQVWSISEIRGILQALALSGGADKRTLALVAIALGAAPAPEDLAELAGLEQAYIVDLRSQFDTKAL